MTYSLLMRDKIRLHCSPANIAALPPRPMDWRRFALGLADSTLIFLHRYGKVVDACVFAFFRDADVFFPCLAEVGRLRKMDASSALAVS